MSSNLSELEATLEGSIAAVEYYNVHIHTVWRGILRDVADALPGLIDAHARELALSAARTMAELPQEAVDDLRRRLSAEAHELGEYLVGAQSHMSSTLKSLPVLPPGLHRGEFAAVAEMKHLGIEDGGPQLAGIESILKEIQRPPAFGLADVILNDVTRRASALSTVLASQQSAADDLTAARSAFARATVASRWPGPESTR
ncbi:hypothetical protein [Gordonia malaquae]|uniref:hypothetical protein n=1 Tax=Gordonia malaquae TaxID=410332 RepID=UPI0030FE0A2A